MRGLLVVQAECAPGTDAEFNRWYDEVHAPETLESEGFASAARFASRIPEPGPVANRTWLTYVTVYRIDADDVAGAYAAVQQRIARGELSRSETMSTEAGGVRVRLFEEVAQDAGDPWDSNGLLLVHSDDPDAAVSWLAEPAPVEWRRRGAARYRAIDDDRIPVRPHNPWSRWLLAVPLDEPGQLADASSVEAELGRRTGAASRHFERIAVIATQRAGERR